MYKAQISELEEQIAKMNKYLKARSAGASHIKFITLTKELNDLRDKQAVLDAQSCIKE